MWWLLPIPSKESECCIHTKGVTGLTCPSMSSIPAVKLKHRWGRQPAGTHGNQAARKSHSEKAREKQTGPSSWTKGRWWWWVVRKPEFSTLKSMHWTPSNSRGSQHNLHCAEDLYNPTQLGSVLASKTACSSGYCSCSRDLLSPKQESFSAFL